MKGVPMDGAAAGTWQVAGVQLFERLLAYIVAEPKKRDDFERVTQRLTRHIRRLLSHVPRVVLDLDGGIPRVNGRALWLNAEQAEGVSTLLKWLSITRASGLVFSGEPSLDSLKRLHMIVARLRSSGQRPPDHRAMEKVLAKAEVFTIHLHGPGGLRRALGEDRTLWHYARAVAAMESALMPGSVPYAAVQDLAEGLATAAAQDPALLLAFPMRGGRGSVGRRATDIAVLCAVWAVAIGAPHKKIVQLTMAGLLHEIGRVWPAKHGKWPVGARICAMGTWQLCEAKPGESVGIRTIAAVEHGLLLSREPFVSLRSDSHPASQVVAASRAFLRGIRKGLTALEVGSRLYGRGPVGVSPDLLAVLVAMVGAYPIGTLVELNNGDMAVVYDQIWTREGSEGLRRPSKTVVERFIDNKDQAIEADQQVSLGAPGPDGVVWAVSRTLKPTSAPAQVASALQRRSAASVTGLGLR